MRRVVWFLMLVGLLGVAQSAFCADISSVAKPGPSVREFALPSIGGAPFRPKISGDWVVTCRVVDNTPDRVIVINVADKHLYTLFNIANGVRIFPSISGNMVAWTGKIDQIDSLRGKFGTRGQAASSLILCDLTDGSYSAPGLRSGSASRVTISGTNVAFEAGTRVYLLDLTSGEQRLISDEGTQCSSTEIKGDLVVWAGKAAGSPINQVYAYQISTGQAFQVTNDPTVECFGPCTDGRYICWRTKNDAAMGVYDTDTKATFSVPKASGSGIDKGVAVYQKRAEKGLYPVYGMDLATRREFRISSDSASALPTTGPDIDGGRVIWCSGGTMYCAELNSKTTANPAVTPTGIAK